MIAEQRPPGRPKGAVPLGGETREARFGGSRPHPPGRPKGAVPPEGETREARFGGTD